MMTTKRYANVHNVYGACAFHGLSWQISVIVILMMEMMMMRIAPETMKISLQYPFSNFNEKIIDCLKKDVRPTPLTFHVLIGMGSQPN